MCSGDAKSWHNDSFLLVFFRSLCIWSFFWVIVKTNTSVYHAFVCIPCLSRGLSACQDEPDWDADDDKDEDEDLPAASGQAAPVTPPRRSPKTFTGKSKWQKKSDGCDDALEAETEPNLSVSTDKTGCLLVTDQTGRIITRLMPEAQNESMGQEMEGSKMYRLAQKIAKNLCSLIVTVWFLKMIVSFWVKQCSCFLLFNLGMAFQHVSFHFLGISFHAKIETWRGGGAGQNKKTCCNSNNKYHDYWTKHTHIHKVVMLKLKPEGVGAGQNKKTCCNSNNKYHDYEPNTRTYTDTLPMTIKYHEHINIYIHVFIYIYILNQWSCTYDTNIVSPRVMHICHHHKS